MATVPQDTDTVTRREFMRRWIEECGITYETASQIYRVMVSTFEEGIASGQKITIGRMGALVPHWQEARPVTMGFKRLPGKVIKSRTTYFLDSRIRYKFRLYREWLATRQLNWFDGHK